MNNIIIELKNLFIKLTHKNLRFENNAYWCEDTNLKDIPYCVNCYQTKGLLIPLIHIGGSMYQCCVCNPDIKIDIETNKGV